eukprot:3435663-Pyramimonas_sp.AAC.1
MGNVLGLCKFDAYILLLILAVANSPDQVTPAGTERRHPQRGWKQTATFQRTMGQLAQRRSKQTMGQMYQG